MSFLTSKSNYDAVLQMSKGTGKGVVCGREVDPGECGRGVRRQRRRRARLQQHARPARAAAPAPVLGLHVADHQRAAQSDRIQHAVNTVAIYRTRVNCEGAM